MEDHFLSLTCPQCGAKLDVYDDTDRFTCSYCESDVEVKRRGGTVSLKLLSNAIRQVQIGTDRTAAELAIHRLEGELAALRNRRSCQLDSNTMPLTNLFEPTFYLAMFGTVFLASLVLLSLGLILAIPSALICLAAFCSLTSAPGRYRSEYQRNARLIEELTPQIDALEAQLGAARQSCLEAPEMSQHRNGS